MLIASKYTDNRRQVIIGNDDFLRQQVRFVQDVFVNEMVVIKNNKLWL